MSVSTQGTVSARGTIVSDWNAAVKDMGLRLWQDTTEQRCSPCVLKHIKAARRALTHVASECIYVLLKLTDVYSCRARHHEGIRVQTGVQRPHSPSRPAYVTP